MRMIRAAVSGLALMTLVACGGSDGATGKAAWIEDHGPALDALETELAAARATLSSLQRPNILGSCTALRDALGEARKGLPVPEQKSNTALRGALDLIAQGTDDCFEGARGPNIPQLEKSFSELREGTTLLDVARRTIESWT
jgi:hypothetical protein